MTKTTVVHVNSPEWAQAVKDGTAVYIGRAVPRRGFAESKWANPFKIQGRYTREMALKDFTVYLWEDDRLLEGIRSELRGKVLGCWCAPQACHGDLLARLADMTDAEFQEWLKG